MTGGVHVRQGVKAVLLAGVLISAGFGIVNFQSETQVNQVEVSVVEVTENTEQPENKLEVKDIQYGSKTLDIENVRWDKYRESPFNQVGWCGEATIQMAGLYYGMYFPQRYIHDAGNPQHSDLYASEISLAMKNIGMEYEKYEYDFSGDETPASSGNRYNGFDKYYDWLREKLDEDKPIFIGVKRYPDEHPNWFADHFVLLVGYTDTSFAFNSNTGEGRIKWRYDLLAGTKHRGYSFVNHNGRRFAYAVTGMSHGNTDIPVHLNLQAFDNEETVVLDGRVENLTEGLKYTIYRYQAEISDAEKLIDFEADSSLYTFSDEVEREGIYKYYCALR